MIGEQEYETARTLPAFVQSSIDPALVRATFVLVSQDDPDDFPGLETLEDADVCVISVRRRTPPSQQMNHLRAFLQRGGSVVGIRTASHAFDRDPPDQGHVRWEDFDQEILGCDYQGHYGNKPPNDPPSVIDYVEKHRSHPILAGLEGEGFVSVSHLYRNRDMSADTRVLMHGHLKGAEEREPVSWVRELDSGSRVFYTSLGHPQDFQLAPFQRMLGNAILWAGFRENAISLVPEIKTPKPESEASWHQGWSPVNVPSSWESDPSGRWAQLDGFGWYRAYFTIPESWRGSRLLLVADGIDDVDEAFFNGVQVGANGSMPPLYGDPSSDIRRPFVIHPEWIRYGKENLVAWRVYDKGGQGGILKGPVHLSRLDDALSLEGTWLFRAGDSPAWSQWHAGEDATGAQEEAQAFRRLVGDRFAGHLGVVEADLGGRQRRIQEVYERYKGNTNIHALTEGKGQPLDPTLAHQKLQTSAGLAVDLVAHEPSIRQPLYVDFDAKGRMWVVQYIQYPDPAGLEVLTWDNHLRKVFDAVPPPPPFLLPEHQKFRGQDRITIHEDKDGDGFFETDQTFLEGLNMCTSFAFDPEGLWVMHPPYLLFYPDRNQDDRPDGPPEVHLSGFGLEDTHSIANSLKWGPDGWLYGATGSTVTARVKVERTPDSPVQSFFGQTIWRYHPEEARFELFAEGGWNNFGVDFDSAGRLYSGTNGNMQAVYFVQGGYYQKSFGKHGPHTHPYTYGHFFGLPIQGSQVRLVHQWILYESGAMESLEGKFVGGNSLANRVHALSVSSNGSRFSTVETDPPLQTEDRWFRPVHTTIGPDGAIYIADWYDARITHVDPRDNWDRQRGRIYRLRSDASGPNPVRTLSSMKPASLLDLLDDDNQWVRATARRLLSHESTPALQAELRHLLMHGTAREGLEALWTLAQMRDTEEVMLRPLLWHPNPHMRRWASRLLCDPSTSLESETLDEMVKLARQEKDLEVLSQLAASAARLPASQGYSLTRALVARQELMDDPWIPQQIWWALEKHLHKDPEGWMDWLQDATAWQDILLRDQLLERAARRLMAFQNSEGMARVASMLQLAPDEDATSRIVDGMEKALQGSGIETLAPSLDEAIADISKRFPSNERWVAFGMRLGSPSALALGRKMIQDHAASTEKRADMLHRLSELGDRASVETMLELSFDAAQPIVLRLAALNALKRLEHPDIPRRLLTHWSILEVSLQSTAMAVLTGRMSWTLQTLRAVQAGHVPKEDVPYEVLVRLSEQEGANVAQTLIREIWGRMRQPEETKQRRMREVEKILQETAGHADAGRELYQQTCALCHVLHGQGNAVGPELTGYDRKNLSFLLPAIIDPSLALREEYELVTLQLRPAALDDEGPTLSGFVTHLADQTLTLKDLGGNETVIRLADIASREHSSTSIMPEGLLDGLSQQQVADLMAYIQAD